MPRRWILSLIPGIALCVFALIYNPVVSSQNPSQPEKQKPQLTLSSNSQFDNFDIRDRQAKRESSEKPAPASAAQAARTERIGRSMREAQQQLAARLPNLKVQFNDMVGVPEIVG